jgi:hypothetical protein
VKPPAPNRFRFFLLGTAHTGVYAGSIMPRRAFLLCPLLLAASTAVFAAPTTLAGMFPLQWNGATGRLSLTIPDPEAQFLLLDTLREGVGANDLGLDRGQVGETRLVQWYRSGDKMLLIQPNLMYRSTSSNPDEQASVADSFARSVLWGFKILSEGSAGSVTPGSVTIDATDFFLHDIHGVAAQLVQSRQGPYHLDAQRSAIEPETLKDFPRNTEVESLLTFTDDSPQPPGKLIGTVTPDPRYVTVEEHVSLIALPPPGYRPRAFDPRAGYFPVSYRDYSAPLGEPMDKLFIIRHRLEKKDPGAKLSDPVQPIVYYVDRGAPEPIRSALIEGASWWSAAFEAAGFRNAFIVKELPEGADPEDIRYNIIDWVDRSTRGWSYGASVVDPRTGEILKGVVTLGSLRARQDFLIAEALLAPYKNPHATPEETKAEQAEALSMVLQRIRQLAAHETGHTLGLAHNFAASTIAPGTSVMDYPHPMITLDADGKPDVSHAYAVGVGAWDKAAIAYGYTQFPAGTDVQAALDTMIDEDVAHGLIYLTDEDARPLGSASPRAHLWDKGADPAAELTRLLAVRKAALARFGPDVIQPGAPMATLEEALVPLYLLHRYQTEAAAKEIGGLEYRYNMRGGPQQGPQMVPAAEQERALQAVLATLDPATLTLPENILQLIPPRPPGYPRTDEDFAGRTGLTFDAQGAVAEAANLTDSLLFEPTRATRLVQYHSRDASQPGLAAVLHQVMQATWYAPVPEGQQAETQRTVQTSVLTHLLALSASPEASPQARAVAAAQVMELKSSLVGRVSSDQPAVAAHCGEALRTIDAWQKNPNAFQFPKVLQAPPGQPIGSGDDAILY